MREHASEGAATGGKFVCLGELGRQTDGYATTGWARLNTTRIEHHRINDNNDIE